MSRYLLIIISLALYTFLVAGAAYAVTTTCVSVTGPDSMLAGKQYTPLDT